MCIQSTWKDNTCVMPDMMPQSYEQDRGQCKAYLAPATSKMGALKLVSRKRPEVEVAIATSSHRSHSYGNIHIKDIGTKMLKA